MRASIDTKRRLAALLILILMLWPAVHHRLVRTHGIDPWRFLGWSMYALPNSQIRLGLQGFVGEQALQIGVGPEARKAGNRFAVRRANLGDFASARPLAQAAFEEHPALDAVEVIVYTRALNRETALFETIESHLHFERDRRDGSRK